MCHRHIAHLSFDRQQIPAKYSSSLDAPANGAGRAGTGGSDSSSA
jgi:hypothetical protein